MHVSARVYVQYKSILTLISFPKQIDFETMQDFTWTLRVTSSLLSFVTFKCLSSTMLCASSAMLVTLCGTPNWAGQFPSSSYAIPPQHQMHRPQQQQMNPYPVGGGAGRNDARGTCHNCGTRREPSDRFCSNCSAQFWAAAMQGLSGSVRVSRCSWRRRNLCVLHEPSCKTAWFDCALHVWYLVESFVCLQDEQNC